MTEISNANRDGGAPANGEILDWVERMGTFFAENYGMPPITGRILSWLLVCEPAEQSAAEIAAAIRASRASLTTNMRLLTASGLARRITRAGARTTFYRVDDDAWEAVIRRRIATLAAIETLTEEGMRLVGPDTQRAARLRATHEVFAWADTLFAAAPGPGRTRENG